MSTPLHNELAAALVELREQQTRITEAVAKVAEASTTVAADDRMVEATVDGQGKLVGLKFHGRRWRDLAPGELAARLVDVVAKAQDQAAAATASVFAGVMPNGMSFTKDSADDLISELDAMFDTAVANGTPQGGPR
ncbi:YbaB/EbfC family nucleoid-associated protein [Actinokineospora auranticolor]|uniref:YbaB/EbfC DNA-binding family protein n=1 Tax=Actinokineospora auranticolor TaxID=155976 RepID=A0A2S6H0H9_9PSEU|nr:YbaB/EbfC family nucleoid-associated protein [Actinokineospora auranticolor]PPK70917.1 YbaB/EbfC DNA-binding family protein [Actinokineospora auranticolor]